MKARPDEVSRWRRSAASSSVWASASSAAVIGSSRMRAISTFNAASASSTVLPVATVTWALTVPPSSSTSGPRLAAAATCWR